ncbi:MAG: hypothetical protein JNM93_03595 [Bacteriovoracaceae bacterium]|nr:hypothetical protein [Bacteriovoracaceae bacterium]
MAKYYLILSLSLFTHLSFAECVPKSTADRERCDCENMMLLPEVQEFGCSRDDDCDYLKNLCGDYTAINRKYITKYKALYKTPIMNLKSSNQPSKAICQKNNCMMVYKK